MFSFLFFTVPPTRIEMEEINSTMVNTVLKLACTTFDSNPEADILWYKNGLPISGQGRPLTLFLATKCIGAHLQRVIQMLLCC